MSSAPLFDPQRLRQSLNALALNQPLSAEALIYQRYYGLDLPQQAKVTRHLGQLESDGEQLVNQLWLPANPQGSLILLHGYYDHMGLYRHLIDWALTLNFAVLSFDLPGHGLSSGPRASIDDFAAYQRALQAVLQEAKRLQLPKPWHLCGQSTGGAIALDFMLHAPEREQINKSLLLSPLVRPRAWLRSKLSYHLLSPFKAEIPRRFSDNSSDLEFLHFLRNQDPLQPRSLPTAWVGALNKWIPRIEKAQPSSHQPIIVQGQLDRTVDWRHNLDVLQRKFNRPQVMLLPQARHHLANEHADIRRDFLDYLSQHLL